MKNRSAWFALDGVNVLGVNQFHQQKETESLFVVGVMGFAGSFDNTGLSGRARERFEDGIDSAIRLQFETLQREYADNLIMASGGTNAGVLEIAYRIANRLGITALTIAPNQVLNYPLASFELAVPFGERFGDESDVFVSLCDAFILVGGGEQSKAETLSADAQGKRVTVIQGFGGVADRFDQQALPNATFVKTEDP